MAHPDDLLGRQVVEERRLAELGVGLAVLRDVVRLDGAAEVARHQLHPVTDAERRDAELEHLDVQLRRTLGVHRGGAAGEDQRERVLRPDLVGGEPVADELRVDPRLTHAPRDQLAVLAAEVEHEHGALLRRRRGGAGNGRTSALLSHAGSSVRLW